MWLAGEFEMKDQHAMQIAITYFNNNSERKKHNSLLFRDRKLIKKMFISEYLDSLILSLIKKASWHIQKSI